VSDPAAAAGWSGGAKAKGSDGPAGGEEKCAGSAARSRPEMARGTHSLAMWRENWARPGCSPDERAREPTAP
jgi:hypothetical protein